MSRPAACPDCSKVFTHRKNLYQHQRNIHKTIPDLLEYPKNFTCDTCGISFTFVQNLYRHKKKVHNAKLNSSPEKHECALCRETFRTQHGYLRHLQISHNEKSETYLFSSKREFEVWKNEEEEKSKALFSTRSCYKVFKNAKRTVFLCHRYGEFKSRNTGRRCLKVQGSTREGNHCTARMEVTEFQNGEVRVLYFPTHKLHGDSVNYVSRKEKPATAWITTEENDSVLIERITPYRKGRIKLTDIKEVHALTENINSNLILTDFANKRSDPSVVFVQSQKDADKVYRVSSTGNPCYPGRPDKKCSLVCSECSVCIHDYKCSCSNWAKYGGLMCKHIHLVSLNKKYRSSLNCIESSADSWESEIPAIDDTIFVEIEVNGDDISQNRLDPLFQTDNLSNRIDLSTFESIINLGKNSADINLDSDVIRKINSSAREYLSLLQSLLAESDSQSVKKVKVESLL